MSTRVSRRPSSAACRITWTSTTRTKRGATAICITSARYVARANLRCVRYIAVQVGRSRFACCADECVVVRGYPVDQWHQVLRRCSASSLSHLRLQTGTSYAVPCFWHLRPGTLQVTSDSGIIMHLSCPSDVLSPVPSACAGKSALRQQSGASPGVCFATAPVIARRSPSVAMRAHPISTCARKMRLVLP